MTRKLETIPVQVVPSFYGGAYRQPCRVLGRIRNLVVCWHPGAVHGDGSLMKTYRARRYYCTVAVQDAAERGNYLPATSGMLSQWQALRLAIVLASQPVDWTSWGTAWQEANRFNTVRDLVARLADKASTMPDDQKKAEEKRSTLINWISWYASKDDADSNRDKYYVELLELEEFMGA